MLAVRLYLYDTTSLLIHLFDVLYLFDYIFDFQIDKDFTASHENRIAPLTIALFLKLANGMELD